MNYWKIDLNLTKTARLLVFLFSIAIISTCKGEKQQDTQTVAVDSIKKESMVDSALFSYLDVSEESNYKLDFNDAVKKNDLRFVGVFGFTLIVPGVKDYDEKYSESNGVKIIRGSSDSYEDSLELSRNVFFESYAESYNELLLDHLAKLRD